MAIASAPCDGKAIRQDKDNDKDKKNSANKNEDYAAS
jgi:hypothetical protein